MIAAGTGVNPMVQMIRDYLLMGSTNRDAMMGTHSRLVLLWQNSVEGDLYCADELTKLQEKAKGLLEVTALISGDMTRRNIPGNAFRRAKARLMKKGTEAGVVSTGVQRGRGALIRESAEQVLMREMPAGLDRLELGRELSRVSEEDSNFTRASRSNRSFGGGRDLDSGGSGGRRDLPWSSNSYRKNKSGGRQDRGGGGGGGGELKTPSGSGMEHSGGHHHDNPRRGGGVGAPSPAVADGENIWSEETDQENGGGKNRENTNRRVSLDNAARNTTGGSSGQAGDTPRSGIRLAHSIRAAGVDRGRWSKATGGRSRGRGGKGKGSHFFGAQNTRVDIAEYSSSDGQPEAAVSGARRRAKRATSKKRSTARPGESPLEYVRCFLSFVAHGRVLSYWCLGEAGGW